MESIKFTFVGDGRLCISIDGVYVGFIQPLKSNDGYWTFDEELMLTFGLTGRRTYGAIDRAAEAIVELFVQEHHRLQRRLQRDAGASVKPQFHDMSTATDTAKNGSLILLDFGGGEYELARWGESNYLNESGWCTKDSKSGSRRYFDGGYYYIDAAPVKWMMVEPAI